MSVGWTHGPWVADLGEVYRIRAADGTVATAQHVNLAGRRSSGEVAANANLIAAAPELYEALEGLVRYAEAARMTAGMGKTQLARLEAGKAALAKARAAQADKQ